MPPELRDEDLDLISDIGDETDITGVKTPVKGSDEDIQAPQNTDVRALLEAAVKADELGNLHGEDGKFVPKNKDAQPGKQTGDGTATTEPAPGTPPGPTPDATAFKLAPEYESLISSLPADAQATARTALVARETAIAQYVQGLAGRLSGYAGVEELIAPRRDAWAVNGVKPEQAIGQLFALSDFATRDPTAFIHWFAGQHNIDLSEAGETYVPPDPQFKSLEDKIGSIASTVEQLVNGNAQTQLGTFQQAVNAFEQEKDAQGQPKYPHFPTVMADMVSLVGALRQQSPHLSANELLQTAYERAVYANPTTRQAAIDAQVAATVKDRAEKARAARTAGQSLPGGAPGDGTVPAPVAQQADTVRGALEAAIALHS